MARESNDHGTLKLTRRAYAEELQRLQAELCALQDWVKHQGLRVIVLFAGRAAAGKGGTIKAITERVSPRVFRVVVLPASAGREKTQMYLQRYMQHFPAAGEIVLFARSWYNRAGVESGMGVYTKKQQRRFLALCPEGEKYIVDSGIRLLKFWFEVSPKEQQRRFEARLQDPLRQGRLSPRDVASRRRWYAYSRARDRMLDATDTACAPWYIVRADDKRRARLNCIAQLLRLLPYETVPRPAIALPERAMQDPYDDEASLQGRRFVPEPY
jgi:polyphosphate kinase 2